MAIWYSTKEICDKARSWFSKEGIHSRSFIDYSIGFPAPCIRADGVTKDRMRALIVLLHDGRDVESISAQELK